MDILQTLLLLCCVGLPIGSAFHPRQCGDGKPTPVPRTVNIESAETCTNYPCKLVKGQDATFELDFMADPSVFQVGDEFKSNIYGYLGAASKVPIPWRADGIPEITSKGGNLFHFKLTFPVAAHWPATRAAVLWDSKNGAGQTLFCFKVVVELVSP